MRNVLVVAILIMILIAGCKAQEITGGNIHIRNKEHDKAIEQFKIATEKYPDQAGPYVSLSAAYFDKKDFKSAADALEKAMGINKQKARESVKWYEGFLHIDNLEWSIFYNGAVIYRDEDLNRALELVKLSEEAESPEALSYSYNLHGNILSSEDKNEEAMEYFKKSIEANEKNINPYISLGRYYVIEREAEKAIPYLEKAITIDSSATEISIALGQAYIDLEEYEKAIKILEKSADMLKNNPGILYNLALSYFQAGNYGSAIDRIKEVINIENVEPEIKSRSYNLLGQIYITEEKFSDAINILEEAIQNNPNNCEAYHLIAIAYLKTDNKQLSSKYADEWDKCLERE
jgi:tetratricopeptide (TPR) repeat protein